MATLKNILIVCLLVKFTFVALEPSGNLHPGLSWDPLLPYWNFQNLGVNVNKDDGKHPCDRRCEPNTVPQTCIYDINIGTAWPMIKCNNCPFTPEDCNLPGCITAGGYKRRVSVANDMLPGPPVNVCLNDTIIFNVKNSFDSDSTTVHFHGAHQRGTPWMDGTPYITQCPILPGNSFQYKFTASPAGTHLWHGHTGVHEADGLFGMYTVRKPDDFENELYDFDEHEMIVWLWSNATASKYVSATDRNLLSYDLLINGKTAGLEFEKDGKVYKTPRAEFIVQKGKRYRFRTVYNSLFACPIQISIDNHNLTMIGSDSGEFKPIEVESFHANAGERFDFVLNANAEVGTYWIRLRSISCLGVTLNVEAILKYTDSKDPEPTYKPEGEHRLGKVFNPIEYITRQKYKKEDMITMIDIESKEPTRNISGTPNITMYLELRFGDATLHPQINGITFEYPHSPLVSQWALTNETCAGTPAEKHCINGLCVCTHVEAIELNSLVEIVIIDTTPGNAQEHPMHLHGDHFQPIAMNVIGDNITAKQVQDLNKNGLIKKKFENVIYKDSITIPNLGYAILRTRATNPGYWFFHCHFTNHAHIGMAMVLKVGDPEKDVPHAPKDFPQCDQFPGRSTASSIAPFLSLSLCFVLVILNVKEMA